MEAIPHVQSEDSLAEQLQEFVYGTISALVVIGALDGKQLGSARSAIVVVLGTAVATWLAHTFAGVIGIHLRERRTVHRHEAIREFRHTWRIVTAAIPATLALLLAGAGVISVRGALSLATILGVAALVVVGVIAGVRSHFSVLGVATYAIGATAIGLIIVAIEIAVFH
jgi:hypothetical protein